jgi:hypothetical protein
MNFLWVLERGFIFDLLYTSSGPPPRRYSGAVLLVIVALFARGP